MTDHELKRAKERMADEIYEAYIHRREYPSYAGQRRHEAFAKVLIEYWPKMAELGRKRPNPRKATR